jgi:hypothetical protein
MPDVEEMELEPTFRSDGPKWMGHEEAEIEGEKE